MQVKTDLNFWIVFMRQDVVKTGTKEECLEYVEETDCAYRINEERETIQLLTC